MNVEIRLDIPEIETEVPRFTPIPLRDRRGRIQWGLKENSIEENLQIGIRNIQGLFLDRYPEFNIRFPRLEDGRIADDQIDQAKYFIKDQIGSASKIANISNSAINRTAAPYFEGSFALVLQRSFEPWGISFEGLSRRKSSIGTKRKAHYWNEQTVLTEARTILENEGNLSPALLEERQANGLLMAIHKYYPGGFRGLMADLGLDSVSKPKGYWVKATIKEEALDFINIFGRLNRSILVTNGRGDLASAITSYPGGMTQLKADIKDELGGRFGNEKESKPEGYWTSENIAAEAAKIYKQEGELNQNTLLRLGRRDLLTVIYRRYPGKMTQLLVDVGINSEPIPTVEKTSKRYYDQDGRSWLSIDSVAKKFKVAESTVKGLLATASQRDGIGANGRKSTLYLEDEADEVIAEFIARPQADQSGTYTDEDSTVWTSKRALSKKLSISTGPINRVIKNIPFILGRSPTGQSLKLYHLEELNRYLSGSSAVERSKNSELVPSPDEANEQLSKLLEADDGR